MPVRMKIFQIKIYISQKVVSWFLFSVSVFAVACEPVWWCFQEVPTVLLPSLTCKAMLCVQPVFAEARAPMTLHLFLNQFVKHVQSLWKMLGLHYYVISKVFQANKREKKEKYEVGTQGKEETTWFYEMKFARLASRRILCCFSLSEPTTWLIDLIHIHLFTDGIWVVWLIWVLIK